MGVFEGNFSGGVLAAAVLAAGALAGDLEVGLGAGWAGAGLRAALVGVLGAASVFCAFLELPPSSCASAVSALHTKFDYSPNLPKS